MDRELVGTGMTRRASFLSDVFSLVDWESAGQQIP